MQIWFCLIILWWDIIPFLGSLWELKNFGNGPRSVVSTTQICNKHLRPLKGNSNSTQQTLLQVKNLQVFYKTSERKLRTQHARREKGETHVIQKMPLIMHMPWQVKFPPPDQLLLKVLWHVKWQLHGSRPSHCPLVSTVLMLEPLFWKKIN